MKTTTFAAAMSALITAMAATSAMAQVSNDKIKVGFITDMSSLYADIDGKGGLDAVKMAIEDHGGKVLGKPIELISADHQNKADIAASKAREWMDQQGLDMLLGGTNSGAALAMNKVAQEKKRVFMEVGAASSRLTNEECSPYTVHYAYDTVALAKGTGSAVVKQGGKSWFFLTADYAFGHSLEGDTAAVVKASGGTVAGQVRHPLSASDFSSFLLQAQSSKAQILGLANAGGDTINSIKAAKEFGINRSMKIAGLLMFINDIHSLGLKNTEGLLMTDSWYWDMNDETRQFASRYFIRNKKMPSSLQAADYSAVSTYLKAVEAAKTDDPDKVMAELKKMKINDFYAKAYVRADGRAIHDMYLLQVKAPTESKKPWDYLKVVATIPGEQAFGTVAESKCPLLRR
ncbi:putative branched-chain amino acid transport system permease, periplasmic component (plasmid) [Cupriavidus taiwanensis]|uniref:ABC transporter permease n=1 Tax=Cupriavidus taiwanensis TaxID=164546 RepID=A0A375HFL4_9BURK|nr:ABC transporter substrate-binding protein [Cupriavidus taiwanensis]SOZ71292.1 putative branched-chain amino acid transport system permease, periplasmic component [Cupriavidus taiwanensis]SOZ72347.1 putative branched-chain amino acid transport system permease, periplasmic component [Cupriavidus taiwanensis]SOZ74652.1 putative branched-chain amino acid transport system permease, periplasmic component [Cupriavidus taiwanensis]SPA03552.1 putative branched-chain amino acid transport system permea